MLLLRGVGLLLVIVKKNHLLLLLLVLQEAVGIVGCKGEKRDVAVIVNLSAATVESTLLPYLTLTDLRR